MAFAHLNIWQYMHTHIQHCWAATLLNGITNKAINHKYIKHTIVRRKKTFSEVFVKFLIQFAFFLWSLYDQMENFQYPLPTLKKIQNKLQKKKQFIELRIKCYML